MNYLDVDRLFPMLINRVNLSTLAIENLFFYSYQPIFVDNLSKIPTSYQQLYVEKIIISKNGPAQKLCPPLPESWHMPS